MEKVYFMKLIEQKKRARDFIDRWKDRGGEKQDSQSFWLDLIQNVYGIENPVTYIRFENKVMLDNASYIDGFIDKTHVMIEQKGKNKDLSKAIKQSDGTFLTPYLQAKRYADNLPYSQRPRWIITCNFTEFYIYDMEHPNTEPMIVKLENLEEEFYRLEFLVDETNEKIEKETKVSMQAGEIVGRIYRALLDQYQNPEDEHTLKSINQLCVRLVFCFYAEDAGLFGKKGLFHDYISEFNVRFFRNGIIDLFEVLNTPEEDRDPYLDEKLAMFPFVNGGLFANTDVEIPQFNDELIELIVDNATNNFNWSEISPTIFGSVFESTLNPDTRRKSGMHYTSIENIHKVINPLFLSDLRNELDNIKKIKTPRNLKNNLSRFQDKLASLKFLDPACGSGNFLTESYLSIRKLENEVIKLLYGDHVLLDTNLQLVKVKINQFYGIEYNDFAVSVAQTALWIAESQMLEETKSIVYSNDNFLPINSTANIHEGNALTIDWAEIVPVTRLNYIIGNPPFVGIRHSEANHRKDLGSVTRGIPQSGSLDYVTGWYIKAAQMIEANPQIQVAFVSTNSVVQGVQATILWKYLFVEKGLEIQFAYKSFIWNSDATDVASVYCVIVGFSVKNKEKKVLFDESGVPNLANNINQYLLPTKTTWIESSRTPLFTDKLMKKGSYPTDGGNYVFKEDEMKEFIKKEPNAEKYFRRWIGAQDMLNGQKRYILFLKNCPPNELKKMPLVMERVKNVIEKRSASTKIATQRKAETPLLLDEERVPESSFLVFPVVSSENRRYIPIEYYEPPAMVYASCFFIEGTDLFDFGILMSNVHHAFMRVVSGRLKSDYRYSNTLVYNNFPWPNVSDKERKSIETTGKMILNARALYPEASLAELYDEVAMPPELRKAHQENDKAVMKAYGFVKTVNDRKTWLSESETVEELVKLYINKQ